MTEFVEFLHEQFAEFGEVSSKRMFGGHGIYHHGIMIGLVADDMLYLKVDAQSEPEFEAVGSKPFLFEKNGKMVKMSYFEAPPETLDDPEEMKIWAERAYAAACRARK